MVVVTGQLERTSRSTVDGCCYITDRPHCLNANEKRMSHPPIGSVSVRVKYTTPDFTSSISSLDNSGDHTREVGTDDVNKSSCTTQSIAPASPSAAAAAAVTKMEKLFDPSIVSPVRLGLADGQEPVKVSAYSVHSSVVGLIVVCIA